MTSLNIFNLQACTTRCVKVIATTVARIITDQIRYKVDYKY